MFPRMAAPRRRKLPSQDCVDRLRILADPTRLQVIRELNEGALHAGELNERIPIAQNLLLTEWASSAGAREVRRAYARFPIDHRVRMRIPRPDDDPERRKAVWLVAANLAAARTGDPARALRAYEAAADISRLRPEHLRAQAELYRQVGQTESFAATYAQWLDDPTSDATSSEHLDLVPTLDELGRQDQALERADRYFGWVTAEPPGLGPEIPFRASRKAPAHARKPGR